MASRWRELPGSLQMLSVAQLADLAVIGVFSLPILLLAKVDPFERVVWRDDRSLMYPHIVDQRIPSWAMVLIAYFIPLIAISAWISFKGSRQRQSPHKRGTALLGLTLALMLAVQLTAIVKTLVGRPRPDFLARCDPDPAVGPHVLCRGPPKLIKDGRRSFPSGHTSSAFAGLGFAGIFLIRELPLFESSPRRTALPVTARLVTCASPFLMALYVAITRTMDYRHHWQDVTIGALIGLLSALLANRLYFPPAPPRGKMASNGGAIDASAAPSRCASSLSVDIEDGDCEREETRHPSPSNALIYGALEDDGAGTASLDAIVLHR